jgi:PAS domain S-box-containing protein
VEHGKKNSGEPEHSIAAQGNLRLEEARALYLPASSPSHHVRPLTLETAAGSVAAPVENGHRLDADSFFDTAPVATFILSREGVVLAVNRAAASDLATSYEQLDGCLFAEFVAPLHRNTFNGLLRDAFLSEERERKSECIELRCSSGHTFRALIVVAANRAGTRCRLIACPLTGIDHSAETASTSEEQFHAMPDVHLRKNVVWAGPLESTPMIGMLVSAHSGKRSPGNRLSHWNTVCVIATACTGMCW